MKKIAILLIFTLLFFSLLTFSFREKLVFQNPFAKKEITTPLPEKDQTRELEMLLREKAIDTSFSPVASESSLLITLASGTSVLFSIKKDLSLQVNSLQIIINKLTIEARMAKKIDFRFEEPIVVY